MKKMSKFGVAAVQLKVPNCHSYEEQAPNLQHALDMIRNAVAAHAFTGAPVKLVVLPECSIQGFPYLNTKDHYDTHVYIQDPGPELDAFIALAKELDIIICTGSIFEWDSKYPAHIFNTTWLVDGTGILLKYRKVTPWVADEGSSSPCQIKGYDEELFPVADTPLGKIGVAICYDFVFPENCRQLAFNGAEILIRTSAYMTPWVANPPMDLWRVTCQMRSMENVCYAIHCNQGSGLAEMPPMDWPGNSMVVDYEGRILSETPYGGDRIVYGHFDMDSLRAWRAKTMLHLGIGHVRTEAYTYLNKPIYPCYTHNPDEWITEEQTQSYTNVARKLIGWDKFDPETGQPV